MLPSALSPTAARTFRAVLEHRSATRPELSAILRVTKQTVSAAIVELEQRQLVEPVSVQHGWTGRSALRYALGHNSGWVAGIDLGSTRLRVAAARLDGTVVAERAVWNPAPTVLRAWPDQLALAAHALADLASKHSESEGGLLGVAVAVPRPVAVVEDLLQESNTTDEEPLLEALVPIAPAGLWIENDVNCSAMAQLRTPTWSPASTTVYLHVGVGLGAAFIVNGRVLRGARGRAGEIKALPSTLSGQESTVESALGAEGFLRAASHSTAAPLFPAVDDLLAAAQMGDRAAEHAVTAEVEGLAGLVHDLCSVLDPDLVIMAGLIGAQEQIQRRVAQRAAELGVEAVIVSDPLADVGAVTGAALLASDRVVGALTVRAERD